MKNYSQLIPQELYPITNESPETLTVQVNKHDFIFGESTTIFYHFNLELVDGVWTYLYDREWKLLSPEEFRKHVAEYHAETLAEIQSRGNQIIEQLKVA